MILKALPPIIACTVLVGLAQAGGQARTYDLGTAFHCSYGVTRDERPAADILVVGNSQTGAGIDQIYLEELLSKDEPLRVEKLAITGTSLPTLRLLIDGYIEHRGAPGLVLYQPLVERTANNGQQGRPLDYRVNLALQDWDDIAELQDEIVANPDDSALPHWTARGYRTLPAMWVDRQVERISAALSFRRNEELVRACSGDAKWKLTFYWPYGTAPLTAGAHRNHLDDPELRGQWSHAREKALKVRWEDPSRFSEREQNRALIAALESAGSEVVLLALPKYGSADEDSREARDLARTFGQDVIDIRTSLSPQQKVELEDHFRDPVHVDFAGAELVTRTLAERIEERER